MCIAQDKVSKEIDMKTSVMETLLCHMTLPPYNLLELLPNACTTCVVTCNYPIEKIKHQSTNVEKYLNVAPLKRKSLMSGMVMIKAMVCMK